MSVNLYISEFSHMARDSGGNLIPIPHESGTVNSKVSFTTATQSNAFGSGTKYVRLISDAACRVAFGVSPTANSSDEYLAAGSEVYRAVGPGDKVSAYDGSS